MKKAQVLLKDSMVEIFNQMVEKTRLLDWKNATRRYGEIFQPFRLIIRKALTTRRARLIRAIESYGSTLNFHTSMRVGGIDEILTELKDALECIKGFTIDKQSQDHDHFQRVKDYLVNYFEKLTDSVEFTKGEWERIKNTPPDLPIILDPIGSIEKMTFPRHLEFGVDDKGLVWIGAEKQIPVSQFCKMIGELIRHYIRDGVNKAPVCVISMIEKLSAEITQEV